MQHLLTLNCGSYEKLLSTRSTHLFSAKGIFCLYKGGISISAGLAKKFLLSHCISDTTLVTLWVALVWLALLVPSRDKVCKWKRKFGTAFCLWPCPVLFGMVEFLPRTAAGPSKGDLVAGWSCMVTGQLSKLEERGKLYQFCPVTVGRCWRLIVSRWKPG